MEKRFKAFYSDMTRNQIKKLHPSLKPLIKSKIEKLMTDPFIGKSLERELSGYLSFSAKRYRIIYKIDEKKRIIEIHYVGHRKDIYELFGDQLREIRSHN